MTFKNNWEKSQITHQLPDGIIKKMIHNIYPNREVESYKVISGGCANLNVKFQLLNEDHPLLLRIYLRDKNAVYRERNIGNLLKDRISVPQIYYIDNIDNYCYAIIEFIPGITLRDLFLKESCYNIEEIMYEVGTILAKFSSHQFLKSGFFDQNLEIIEELDNNSLKEFSLSCLSNINIKKHLDSNLILKIRFLLNKLPSIENNNINLVHADFDPANILVSKVNNKWKVAAILDWEFSYSGSWLNDVANMLRYSHHMPNEFESSFLEGLMDNGLKLPNDWQIITNQYNLASLLDSMTRHDLDNCPNIKKDICSLINHIITELDILRSY